MIWSAWNNGKHHASGAGYGFRIKGWDRDQYFRREWKTVIVTLPSPSGAIDVTVNIDKDSFWNQVCRELLNKQIGQWLRQNGYAPWPKGTPPRFEVSRVADRHFVIDRLLTI